LINFLDAALYKNYEKFCIENNFIRDLKPLFYNKSYYYSNIIVKESIIGIALNKSCIGILMF